jgi:purine-cytosine permease-like protein
MMVRAGLGAAGLIIVIISTVTTTFLDAYSAGVSAVSILSRLSEKWAAVAVCGLGTALAIFTPIAQVETFLYLIGSVFAPMTAVLITDVYLLKKDFSDKSVNIINLIIWAAGFGVYRLFLKMNTPVGSTLPAMLITTLLSIVIHYVGGINIVRKNAR